jgi:uncharacterized protein (TIGR00297 family)
LGVEYGDEFILFDCRAVHRHNTCVKTLNVKRSTLGIIMQLLLGFLFAIIIAVLAYRAHSLNKSGALAAVFTGTIIFGVGGWEWAILLLTFFITSSALSRAFQKNKRELDEKFSKGHERDAGQVFGNGGIAAAFAALNWLFPNEPWTWVGFAAALAAVNADTWGT